MTPLKPRSLDRFFNVGQEIEETAAREIEAVAYSTPHLINCTLPHRDPGTSRFVRSVPWMTLTLYEGKGVGLPYGPKARLYYAKLITKIVQTRQPKVTLASTLTELARVLGTSTDGRSLRAWKKQMLRCYAANWDIEAEEDLEDGMVRRTYQSWKIVQAQEYVYDSKKPDQMQLFEPTVEVSEAFFNQVINRAVPFDMRALKALSGSSLAMDLYTWMTIRVTSIEVPTEFPFSWLMQQFGTLYNPADKKARNNFQNKLKAALVKIRALWPEVRFELVPGALLLHPGAPHIRRV